jgi:hypothetical protein
LVRIFASGSIQQALSLRILSNFAFLKSQGTCSKARACISAKFERALCRVCGVEIDARQFHRLFMRLTLFTRLRGDELIVQRIELEGARCDLRIWSLIVAFSAQPQPGGHIIGGLIAVNFTVQPPEARKTGHKTDLFYPEPTRKPDRIVHDL